MSFGGFSVLGARTLSLPSVGIPSEAVLLAGASNRSHPREPGPSPAGSNQASQFAGGHGTVSMAPSRLGWLLPGEHFSSREH